MSVAIIINILLVLISLYPSFLEHLLKSLYLAYFNFSASKILE